MLRVEGTPSVPNYKMFWMFECGFHATLQHTSFPLFICLESVWLAGVLSHFFQDCFVVELFWQGTVDLASFFAPTLFSRISGFFCTIDRQF
jgi:hypothetical protein